MAAIATAPMELARAAPAVTTEVGLEVVLLLMEMVGDATPLVSDPELSVAEAEAEAVCAGAEAVAPSARTEEQKASAAGRTEAGDLLAH